MDCVININKPEGLSSFKVVNKIRYSLNLAKAGHTGTLDPIAGGVLLLCTGRATKISAFLSSLDKEYLFTMKLGSQTDTLDREGKVIKESDASFVTAALIDEVLKSFTGDISQVPPMYSAVKYKGAPLYKLARKGLIVERRERSVSIYSIEMVDFKNPMLTLKVSCSKGTYIRVLCSDIAENIGTCAYVNSLVRTRVGEFSISDALTLEDIESMDNISNCDSSGFYSPDRTLCHLPELFLSGEEEIRSVLNGMSIEKNCLKSGLYRVKDESGTLIGVGDVIEDRLKLSTMLVKNNEYLKQKFNYFT